MKRLWIKIKDFWALPDTFDPEDIRYRRIIDVSLITIGFTSFISALFTFQGYPSIHAFIYDEYGTTMLETFLISLSVFMVTVGFFFLNRRERTPKYLIGSVLVAMLTAAVPISDTPQALLEGSLLAWPLPIIFAAILLPPRTAFLIFVIESAEMWYLTPSPRIHNVNWWAFISLFLITFVLWVVISISERSVRDAHNESGKNNAILKGIAEGVVVYGKDNRVVLANPVALELLGQQVGNINQTIEKANIEGRALSFSWSDVKGVGWVAIVRDVSRQVEIDKAKDAILGVVSHEMRTPLAAILGFAEIMQKTLILDPALLERIHANALHMVSLVDDLLDEAQIAAGTLKIAKQKFQPISLANAVRDSLSDRAQEKDITLKITVSESLPEYLVGDFHRYQQILINLVNNAIKFTGSGGCVDALLTPGDSTGWQMIVSDTGVGIPPERLPDIFEPFRRHSDFTTRSHPGVGLGLSISRKIAKLAGGDIQVKSFLNHGSTFTVTLPYIEGPDENHDCRR